ncbi:hypothetical protein BBF96_10840 [Anoxybacter fermentans]|uniref:Crp/Fnr family transcriptional regulator n=1 Tax=Anoxybacter fermentans TaxID=1323375 RepID=A0A3Q9HTH1_9FIRM|nr:hypothetical protein BBF96_10840 [Anoxybacter fermentans]
MKTFLKNETIFGGLTDEELTRVIEIMVIRQFERNVIIFFEGEVGDNFYLVLSGEVRIYKISPDGREKNLALIGPGDFFGEMALIDKKTRSATAETMSKTRLGVIHQKHFSDLIDQYPEIALKMIVQLTERLRRANQQIESLTFKDVQGRLVQFLLQYADENEDDDPVPLKKRVTHQIIANQIGASRETVSRILSQLQKEGYITIKNRLIYITKRKELKDRWERK